MDAIPEYEKPLDYSRVITDPLNKERLTEDLTTVIQKTSENGPNLLNFDNRYTITEELFNILTNNKDSESIKTDIKNSLNKLITNIILNNQYHERYGEGKNEKDFRYSNTIQYLPTDEKKQTYKSDNNGGVVRVEVPLKDFQDKIEKYKDLLIDERTRKRGFFSRIRGF